RRLLLVRRRQGDVAAAPDAARRRLDRLDEAAAAVRKEGVRAIGPVDVGGYRVDAGEDRDRTRPRAAGRDLCLRAGQVENLIAAVEPPDRDVTVRRVGVERAYAREDVVRCKQRAGRLVLLVGTGEIIQRTLRDHVEVRGIVRVAARG